MELYYSYLYHDFFRYIGLSATEDALTGVWFAGNEPPVLKDKIPEDTPLLINAKKQLEEYFSGKRKVFDLPLQLIGTPFQEKVWNALTTIPYGATCSYKEIAIKVNNPKGYQAIGGANNKNPIAIIVPCHRVVGIKGAMVGYASGIAHKEYLLNLEEKNK